ncbi:hypothetical protein ACFWZ1_15595 [Frateuria sp. GZRe14]|jgi:hypothetical protein|uniref:hypothetical protein n=1 Tax=unclassified Frateuria TaxID=2648894 RepID=UPI003EDBCD2B
MSKVQRQVTSKRSWLLAHALAVVTIVVTAYMLFLNFRYANIDYMPPPSVAEKIFIPFGVPSVFWFWGWMLTDFFRSRPMHASVAWGWFLLLGLWLASVPYFFFIWRPRHAGA